MQHPQSAADRRAAEPPPQEMMVEEIDYRRLKGVGLLVFTILAILAVLVSINQLFNLNFFVGVVLIDNRYLFVLTALLLPLVFLAYPAGAWAKKHSPLNAGIGGVPWHDWVVAIVSLIVVAWFAMVAERGLKESWEYAAPRDAIVFAGVLALIILEALRRTGGLVITIIVLVVALYPVIADKMPGPISGLAQPLPDTIAYHIFSSESAFGIPMRAFGEIVVGFIIFGVALNHTGGGKFFNDVAFALVGRYRGGAAQVGVISSALQGSISGSVISNVISSGVVTIPAMKRTGFTPEYAGGVEAVASTGAVLMPPVMGSTAFVMASFLGMPYSEIALAATIPALLFYFGLAVQIDSYSARRRLSGMAQEEVPAIGKVLREGWLYILVFVVLIALMLRQQGEELAPYYATAVLLVINQFNRKHRLNFSRFIELVASVGRGLAELVAVLTGVGFIVGAFSMTGLAGTLANDLVYMAGGAPVVLLIMGAITSFIFGMGMTVTACYIFLAIVLAPPLVKAGMDPLAVHLFIMYWGMVSFITPPVALAAFAAAPIARTSFFRIGFEAMRLGSVIYIVPFFFALNPALILRGTWNEIVVVTAGAFAGIWLIASAMQGYLAFVGPIPQGSRGIGARTLLLLGGFALALPGGSWIGIGNLELNLTGIALAVAGIVLLKSGKSPSIA